MYDLFFIFFCGISFILTENKVFFFFTASRSIQTFFESRNIFSVDNEIKDLARLLNGIKPEIIFNSAPFYRPTLPVFFNIFQINIKTPVAVTT